MPKEQTDILVKLILKKLKDLYQAGKDKNLNKNIDFNRKLIKIKTEILFIIYFSFKNFILIAK